MAVVRDDAGNIFRGFVDVAWSSAGGNWVASQKSFLFVLKSVSGGDTVHVLPLTGGENQHAVYIDNDGHANTNSSTKRQTYNLDGSQRNFKLAEVEVFQIFWLRAWNPFNSLPGQIKSFTDQVCAAMAAIGSNEHELLREALLVEHLAQCPLSDLPAAMAEILADRGPVHEDRARHCAHASSP